MTRDAHFDPALFLGGKKKKIEAAKDGGARTSIKCTWTEFMLGTSIHGLRYLIISESSAAKLLWALATLLASVLCGLLVRESFSNWLEQPYITYVESVPIAELDFPAVTVCPEAWSTDSQPPLEVFERFIQVTNNSELRRIYTEYMFSSFIDHRVEAIRARNRQFFLCIQHFNCTDPSRAYVGDCRDCLKAMKEEARDLKDLLQGVASLEEVRDETMQFCNAFYALFVYIHEASVDPSTEVLSVTETMPDVRGSSLSELVRWATVDLGRQPGNFSSLQEMHEQVVGEIMSVRPVPPEDTAKAMAASGVWDCQEWAILRWLWQKVVADEDYVDRRIRGTYLLRGHTSQRDGMNRFGQYLAEHHRPLAMEMADKLGIDLDVDTTVADNFAEIVFQAFFSTQQGLMRQSDARLMVVSNFLVSHLESHSYLPGCSFDGMPKPDDGNAGSIEQLNCPHFRTTFTDKGFCVTFNLGSYSDVYKDAKSIGEDEDNIGDTRDRHVKHRGFHFYFDSNAVAYGFVPQRSDSPFVSEQMGNAVRVHPFTVSLHRPGHLPTIVGDGFQTEGTKFSAGDVSGISDISIYFKVDSFNATDAFKSLPVSSRRCLLQDEVDLELVEKYSQLHCRMECVNGLANEFDRCTLDNYYHISMAIGHEQRFPVCGSTENNYTTQGEFLTFARSLEGERFDRAMECIYEKCLPACVYVEYDTIFSSKSIETFYPNDVYYVVEGDFRDATANLGKGGELKDYLEDEGDTELIAPELKAAFSLAARQTNQERAVVRASQNLARVSVVFSSGTGRVVTKDVSMTIAGALSSVGGSLGLCTGFSILSLCEILYYAARTAKNVLARKKTNKKP